ncbi:serpin I2-like [Cydia pomonella]|uniref:serpin I2-like n=1 Tax=Cydia pomonella TaxID=82600 RepID=UPI002ADE85FD|nr:serpin I2-like [Cydia pomonella]
MRTAAVACSTLAVKQRIFSRADTYSYEYSCSPRRHDSRIRIFLIVAYVVSSFIGVKGQRLLTLNPISRSITPFKMHRYSQSAWKNCYLYSACPKCCINWYPRFATGSTPLKIIPVWDSTVRINRKGQVWPLSNYPMLRVNKISLPVHSDRTDHYRLLSLMTSTVSTHPPSAHSPINNLSRITTVTLNSLNKTSESMITYQKNSVKNKMSSDKPGPFFNNTFNGRRMNDANSKRVTNTKPKLLQNKADRDHMHNSWNASTTVPPLDVATTESVPSLMQYHYGTTSTTSFNTSSHNSNETDQKNRPTKTDILFKMFRKTLDQVERKFLLSAFNKLTAISPDNRKENGISFLQSGLFLYHLLMSLSLTMDQNAVREIEEYFGLNMSEADKIEILERTVSWLPKSSEELKFRWSSRLVLQRVAAGNGLHGAAARVLPLRLSWLVGNETSTQLAETLNSMVLSDSGGSMHDTFSEEEVEAGVCAAALGTVYLRGTWRTAPTLLNDTLPFRDSPAAPNRSSRYFRLNDLMAYSYLHEWDTEAIEIPYAMPGLTLLILVPKELSLRPLVERAAAVGLDAVVGVMHTMRIAVTLPLYTLRMTLLLPNKLQDMGMQSLLTNGTDCQPVRLSHAVQRLMFWAEAGRNAFKDDGIEWDPRPELEIVVDRPYLFFVRWNNVTIMNGVFVL